MKIRYYKIRLKHDKGFSTVYVAATAPETAVNILCGAEHCPRHAIRGISEISETEAVRIYRRNNPGGISLAQAKALRSGSYIHHPTKKNADGTPMRARVTSVKTWKRDPSRVEIHYKHGMYDYGVFTEKDLDQVLIGYGS